MKRDEYNVERITNEEDGLSFEFGSTQDEESTSYPDNRDKIRDEINDNPVNNGSKRPKKEKKERKDRSSKKDIGKSSPESSISSSTATISTIVGASLVSVVTLSALVGINLFFSGKCNMNMVEPSTNSISYELDLTDINDDKCVIKLEHLSYSESQELEEGFNSGEFIDLNPSTEYHISVIDLTYNNYILFEDNVSTKEEYIPPVETYTVTFISNGGSEVESQVVNAGEKVTKPADPEKEDYIFEGWYSDSGLTNEYNFDAPVTSDITLYAKWKEIILVTISFDANGGEGEQDPGYAHLGDEYILPECTFTAPSGYVFDCWQLSGTDEKYNPGEAYLIESEDSITFMAKWAEAATIEFYPGIGATGSVTSIKVAVGKDYTIPSGDDLFTAPTDKEFDYWFDDMESVDRYARDVITITDTYYSFTAHWKYLPGITYTVTFNSNGGSEVEPQVVNAGETATKPDDPIKEDYIFKGWYSNEGLTSSYSFLLPVTSDITLYAKWEVAAHTVTFITNGGPEITPQEVNDGECAIKPTDPVRGSYAFVGKDINTDSSQYYGYETDAGFSLDKYGTNYLCNKTAIPGEIVSVSLYTFSCQKTSITYNVGFATTQLSGRSTAGGGSYELAGGSDYTFDNSVEGATYFSISCNEYDNGGDYSTVACIDKIVVVYNLETDGTSTVTFDTFNDLPPGYTDSDPITFYSVTGSYNFAGWYIDAELTEEYDFNTPVTKDITLYAKWTATYSVSGAAFNGFPHSTVGYATEADVGGITLEASAYSCYYNDAGDGHGLWIPLGSDSQSPEDSFSSYVANKTPINGSIKSIAITVGPSAYGGSSSNATLHVTFGKEPLLEHLVSGTTITYESDATIIVDCSMDGFSYFNITNVTENGLVIESIVITYTVN